ncbi:MAG: hypothetical protein DDG59_04485 [Anaerolineae bacterium]|jgi:hypothetical protein|nr:MAG: hypothetical protein DDG59_04485 [Anaerolineae bacterium]
MRTCALHFGGWLSPSTLIAGEDASDSGEGEDIENSVLEGGRPCPPPLVGKTHLLRIPERKMSFLPRWLFTDTRAQNDLLVYLENHWYLRLTCEAF